MGFAGGVGAGVKSALSPTLSRKRERGLFGVGGEFGVILKRLTSSRHSRERGNPGFASKLAPTKSKSTSVLALVFALGTSRETSERTGTPLQKAERSPRSGGHATWMSREPRGLQGRTLGAGLRGGGIREGSPTPSGPYAGQAFLVPFVAFDKRDSPEGAKQEISADSVRRGTPKQDVSGLFPFGPAQALFAMEPRPAFAGMTGVGGWRLTDASLRTAPSPFRERVGERERSHPKTSMHPGNTIREQARSYRKDTMPPWTVGADLVRD